MEGKRIQFCYEKIYKSILAYLISNEAKFRMEVLDYFKYFGLDSTRNTYKLSKTTIYCWKNILKQSKRKPSCLISQSRRPKRIRRMETDIRLINMISDLRKLHYRIGKKD